MLPSDLGSSTDGPMSGPPVRFLNETRASHSPRTRQRSSSMRRFLRKMLKSQSGQGMSEYLIIVALIAIAAIGVVTVFGRDIRELFSGTTDSLAGNQATNTAKKATVKANKNLKTFGKYNAASGD